MTGSGRQGLAGLLLGNAVSLGGTRLSTIALPWFVLVTTGSATSTGLVVFCEMTPYVISKALGGPLVDRVGPRLVSVVADLLSVGLVGLLPLLHTVGLLPFPALLAIVAAAGAARGPGDGAKSALLPDVAEAAGVPLERAAGLNGTVDRLAQIVGPLAAGALIAWVGPLTALTVDAGSFAVAAALISLTAPRPHPAVGEAGEAQESAEAGYLARLRAGFDFLRGDRLLRGLVGMVTVTNLIDSAMFSVLIPVWANQEGRGPAAIGTIASAMGVTAMAGSLVATAVAHRLPRRATYLVSFLVGGAPRVAVLALDVPLWVAVTVWAVGGFGSGFVNPILSAVLYERIPRPLLGRVNSLVGTLAWAGIPLGGPVGGVLITLTALNPAIWCCAAVHLAANMLPALRSEWREMDATRGSRTTQSTQEPVVPAGEVG